MIDKRKVAGSLVAALILGAVSTLGDWIWANYLEDGALAPAIGHGIIIFMVLALVLGGAARSLRATRRMLVCLPVVGFAIAAAFYPIAALTGYLAALILSWFLMWIALATVQRWARRGHETLRWAIARATLAALASGFAFWTISGIWTDPSRDPDYGFRLLAWTWAFLPGFAALLIGHESNAENLE